MQTNRTRSRFAFLHVAALVLALIGATAYADNTPPAPPTGTSPAATAPAPVTPPAPTTPGATVPAPGARREETEGQEQPPAPGAQTAGLFDRALAYMQTKDGLAAKISGLEAENKRLQAELEKANGTIQAQNAELGELRAGKEKIEAALGKLETEQTTVSGTVAALGFQAQKLPPQNPIEASGDTEEELLAQFRAETNATKKADLAAKLRAVREKAA